MDPVNGLHHQNNFQAGTTEKSHETISICALLLRLHKTQIFEAVLIKNCMPTSTILSMKPHRLESNVGATEYNT